MHHFGVALAKNMCKKHRRMSESSSSITVSKVYFIQRTYLNVESFPPLHRMEVIRETRWRLECYTPRRGLQGMDDTT